MRYFKQLEVGQGRARQAQPMPCRLCLFLFHVCLFINNNIETRSKLPYVLALTILTPVTYFSFIDTEKHNTLKVQYSSVRFYLHKSGTIGLIG
jgi:hypothetical protein